MTECGASGVRWWLWPNVLALDAPIVAVVWQRFLADSFGVAVPVLASAVLSLVVWAIYLTDRRLDARVGENQPRHVFAATHPKLVTTLAVLAFLTAGVLAIALPPSYLAAGGVVAALVAGYLGLVHLAKTSLRGGKEFLVGLLFAAGVAVPLIASDAGPAVWLAAVCGFGLLCWLNCRLIERWEAGTSPALGEALLGAGVVACAATCPRAVAVALAAAAGLLFALHLLRSRNAQVARVLADVALLTPLAAWALA